MKNHEADSTGLAAHRPGEESKRGLADTGLLERTAMPPQQPCPTPTPVADAAAPPAEASVAATR